MIAEGGFDQSPFVFSEQAVVDEDADELIADGFVQQGGDDGGIDPAGQAADDFGVADLLAHPADGVFDKPAHRPETRALADFVEEVLEELLAARRVRHFGVKLHAIERPVLCLAAA